MLRGLAYLWKDIKSLSKFEIAVLVFVMLMFLFAVLDSWNIIRDLKEMLL